MPDDIEGTSKPNRRFGLPAALGLLAFLVGASALVWVFITAFQLYGSPAEHLVDAGSQSEPDLRLLAQSATSTLLRVLILAVMAVAAALLAGVGARFYLSALTRD